jgi:signal transduction histidine kinase
MLDPKSLRLKLIVSCLLLTLIPLSAIGIYGHVFTTSSLSQQALERSIHQVHLQAESILSALRQVQGDALYLSALRSLKMLHQQTQVDQQALWTREVGQDLLVLASVRPMYYAIRLIDADGDEIIGVRAVEDRVSLIDDPQNRRAAPYFRETMRLEPNEVYVSPFQTQDSSGVPYIHYAVRLPDGVLVIDLHAGWLLRSLPEHPGSDTWALINQDGHFLVYPDGFDPRTIVSDVPKMLQGGRSSFETATSVYAYETIYPTDNRTDDNFWVIFRHTPTDVLYASVNDFYHIAFLLLVIGMTFAVVLAIFVSQVLVGPVKQLEEMTLEFGRTGIAPPLPERLPDDEIGALTRAFVDTARELEGKRRQEHRLIERLIRAQEEERKLLAYDLHDGLIQQMVGARFYLNISRDQCMQQPSDVNVSLQHGCDALSGAIVEARRIIEGLRPAALDDLGLTAAIEEIAMQTAEAAGWQLTLDLRPLPTEPDMTVTVTLYRIAQEALSNARKHAHAEHVTVSLHNGSGIYLSIHDDGVGFDPAALGKDGRGLGITTMQERASLLGGRCEINSQPGYGTQIDVFVPCNLQTIVEPRAERELV